MMIYKDNFKRILDFTLSLIGLILLSPIFLFVWIWLSIANRQKSIVQGLGQAFFFQERPGINEKIFKVIKFKTMNDKRDANGALLPDAERLTKIGGFVRSTSLDEIPQLINVLRGDMSLIGPRPLRTHYLPLYNQTQKRRHDVRLGITGWAQVNGRNDISWTKKFELDVWYVDNLSLSLDIKIIFKTIYKVFKREGISKEGEVTTVPFDGNN